MSLTLNTNVASLLTQQYLNVNALNTQNALQQLSSGNKLNGPADDPAGYAIAYKLGVKSASLTTSINNGNQGLAMLQVAQGGITQIGAILTQLKQIATEAASSTTDSTNLTALNTQVTQLFVEIDIIATGTQYGGVSVLQGGTVTTMSQLMTTDGIDSINVGAASAAGYTMAITGGAAGATITINGSNGKSQTVYASNPTQGTTSTVSFSSFGISLQINSALTTMATQGFTVTGGSSSFTYQVGAENQSYAQIGVSISNFGHANASGLNLGGASDNVASQANAQIFMGDIDTATNWLNTAAGSIGASQDEIQYQVANLQSMNTNTQSAASTIKDTDYAKSMSNFSQAQIASQASVAMLAQANAIPQEILTLIKG